MYKLYGFTGSISSGLTSIEKNFKLVCRQLGLECVQSFRFTYYAKSISAVRFIKYGRKNFCRKATNLYHYIVYF